MFKLLDFIPLPYKILGIIAVVLSIYGAGFYGGYSLEHKKFEAYKTDQKIKDLETEAKFQTELQDRTNKLMTEYNTNLANIAARGTKYVTQATTQVPHQYDLSNGWVSLHDGSARGQTVDAAVATDATPSGIGDNQALATVVSNYSRCNQTEEQLKALQQFINEYNAAVAAAEAMAKKPKKWFSK